MDFQPIDEPSTSTISTHEYAMVSESTGRSKANPKENTIDSASTKPSTLTNLARRVPRSFDIADYLLDLVPQDLTFDYLTQLRKTLEEIDTPPQLPDFDYSVESTDQYLTQAASDLIAPKHYQNTPFIHYSKKAKRYVNPMMPCDPNPALEYLNNPRPLGHKPTPQIGVYQPKQVCPVLASQQQIYTGSSTWPQQQQQANLHTAHQQQANSPFAYEQQDNPTSAQNQQSNSVSALQQEPLGQPEPIHQLPSVHQQRANLLPNNQQLAILFPEQQQEENSPSAQLEPIYYHHAHRFSSINDTIQLYATELYEFRLPSYMCGNRPQMRLASGLDLLNLTSSENSSDSSYSDEDEDEDDGEDEDEGEDGE